ncbi:hypothetical protein HON52_05030 [Candidatus Uhrbacteria bacterium]|jgi:hypothetical protein|nr:hypothetical protein [Candidatus Uhrbacteria bacterium]
MRRNFITLILAFFIGMLGGEADAGSLRGYGTIGTPSRVTPYSQVSSITNQKRYTRNSPHELLGWCKKDRTAVWLSGTYGSCGPNAKLLASAPDNPPKGEVGRFRYFNQSNAQAGIQPPNRSWRVKKNIFGKKKRINGGRVWRYDTVEGYEAWVYGNSSGPNVSLQVGVGNSGSSYGHPGYGGRRLQ